MILYTISSILGSYVDLCINPEDTYKAHLFLLKEKKHHCFKLQYIYDDGFDLELKIIQNIHHLMATMSLLLYSQKQDYILNSKYPVVFDRSKYTKDEMHIIKPSEHVCIMKRYYDGKIMGIEIDEYGIIEEGYYKIYKDHLERLE